MPSNPPKWWADETIATLSKTPGIEDPGAVMGWMWRYWLKPKTKRAILAGERRRLDPRTRVGFKPPPAIPERTTKMLYDPQRMSRVEDYIGYAEDGSLPLNVVRVAHQMPEPEGHHSDLIEGVIVLPNNVFDRLEKKFKDLNWQDLEYDKKEDMYIRRGASNRATNLFIMREESRDMRGD